MSILKNGEVLLSTGVSDIDKMNLIKLTYTQISKEEHLKDLSREFYQYLKYNEAILQFLPVILLVVDGENRIKVANQSAREFFGADRRHLLNRSVYDLFASSTAHIVSNLLTFSDSSTIAEEEIDLNELIEEMIDLVRYSARKNEIRIEFIGEITVENLDPGCQFLIKIPQDRPGAGSEAGQKAGGPAYRRASSSMVR